MIGEVKACGPISRIGHWTPLLAGSLALASGQWLSLWLIARTATAETVGQYALALAWLLPLFAACGLQLRALMATDVELPARLPVYRKLRVAGALLAAGVAVAWACWFPADAGGGAVLLAATLPRLVELGSDFADGRRHCERRYADIARSQIARAAAAIAGLTIVWLTTEDLVLALAGSAASALVSLLIFDRAELTSGSTPEPWADMNRPGQIATDSMMDSAPGSQSTGSLCDHTAAISRHQVDLRRAGILRHAVPLALVGSLNQSFVSLPRLQMGSRGDLDGVATFSCMLALLSLPNLLASAYAASLAPDIAQALHSATPARVLPLIRSAVGRVGNCAVVGVLLLPLVGPALLPLVFGAAYQVSWLEAATLSLFAAVWSVSAVYGTAATAARWVGLQVVAFSSALLVTAGIGVWSIPEMGVGGAAASLLAGAVVLFATYAYAFASRLTALGDLTDKAKVERVADGSISRRPIRVLHVTSALDVGGVEVWLSRLLETPLPGAKTAILSIGANTGNLAADFEEKGVPVFCVPASSSPWRFVVALVGFLRRTGPWDVVHSHVGRRSAFVLLAARMAGIRGRVSHGHHAGEPGRALRRGMAGDAASLGWAGVSRRQFRGWAQTAYSRLSEALLCRLSSERIACSMQAARSLYGRYACPGKKVEILHCGLDLDGSRTHILSASASIAWQRPAGSIVVAHVGRFAPEKNHEFLVAVAEEAIGLDARFHFLLIGDGPLREEMEWRVQTAGLEAHVHFLGWRSDVLAILARCADAFFFPSRSEGLGVAMVEAQLAGLPCFYAVHLPKEVDLFPESNATFSLHEPATQVASSLRRFVLEASRSQAEERIATLADSPYSIAHNRGQLAAIYRRSLARIANLPSTAAPIETDSTREANAWN